MSAETFRFETFQYQYQYQYQYQCQSKSKSKSKREAKLCVTLCQTSCTLWLIPISIVTFRDRNQDFSTSIFLYMLTAPSGVVTAGHAGDNSGQTAMDF